ncbi:2Fe-2S iron-sulfur cluster binding domain-containing protein [Dechloromonas sp. XY25]|uniref:2Fe-2S iron-sulfur cluster binding domain-containing protein n=1 Tax=Dechloromonas hankyongensis TaxID=2908002 RepID=A0ABS9K133_9RHOO|nr:2Fe-2S iron-sulfur cluster binding domain-containing protein [Dechloromonas hankyongensis]MCG2576885.1 2Fe-2S iron-sulfur cluster binding domain-containing protein [Dechloromonas hankyongensis]
MIYFNVLIEETGETFRCSPNESLLVGMERLGKKGIPVGCRGGGCGVCKVEITSGSYQKRVMSRDYVSVEDEAAGRVLACRVRPTSDITLRVLGKMAKNVCRTQTLASAVSAAA